MGVFALLLLPLFLHLWHRLGGAGEKKENVWAIQSHHAGQLPAFGVSGFQQGGDQSEKRVTPHTYRVPWSVVCKPGAVCLSL